MAKIETFGKNEESISKFKAQIFQRKRLSYKNYFSEYNDTLLTHYPSNLSIPSMSLSSRLFLFLCFFS